MCHLYCSPLMHCSTGDTWITLHAGNRLKDLPFAFRLFLKLNRLAGSGCCCHRVSGLGCCLDGFCCCFVGICCCCCCCFSVGGAQTPRWCCGCCCLMLQLLWQRVPTHLKQIQGWLRSSRFCAILRGTPMHEPWYHSPHPSHEIMNLQPSIRQATRQSHINHSRC